MGEYEMYLEMSDKVNLYVRQVGQGIPCIFVHGGPGEGSLDFEVLGGNVLEGFMNMIYFDQRGSARSEGDEETDMEEIRKKLGISKWIVMAHSFGGIIATNYAHKYGEAIDKLILLNVTLSMEGSFKSQIYHGSKLLSENELKSIEAKSYMENKEEVKSVIEAFIRS